MATFIYSRVSTDRQETENQLHVLQVRFPEARVVEETMSGSKHRPLLDHLLSSLTAGDTLIVYALDRLGRRCGQLVNLFDDLSTRKVNLISIRENIDFSTGSGQFMSHIFAAMAQFERSLISDRTRTALARKKAEGVKLGRPRVDISDRISQCQKLRSQKLSYREIANQLHVSLGTVSSTLSERKCG